uniref:Secreted protein n=1 Tax=Alexandrium andersonii TaxID=327968 RepID=A0A7S2DWR5_9DINO
MAFASKLLSFACCVAGASAAAYQELLLLRHVTDKQQAGAWPVDHSQIDFLRVVQESLSSVMDTPEIINAQEAEKAKNPNAKPFPSMKTDPKMFFKMRSKESRAGVFLDFPAGCQTGLDMQTACKVNLTHQLGHGKVNFVHAEGFDANSTVHFEFGVNSAWNHVASTANCRACGQKCTGTFLGRTWSVDLPDCPVKPGTWSFSFPFLSRDETESLPAIPTFQLSYKFDIKRPTGKSALNFEGSMDA